METCPAEAIRAAVTACADGEPPTYDEIRLAQAAVGNAMERDVLHPYYPFMGGVAVTKGPRQPVAERPLTGEEQHLVELYHRVTCRGRTRPQRNGLEMTRGEAFYGLGRLYRDASHWEEAAAAFHEDARAEGTESGIYSAQFSLEVLDVLAHRDDRQDCRDAVVSRARIYARAHCGDAKVDDDDWCRRLEAFPSRRDRFLDPYPR